MHIDDLKAKLLKTQFPDYSDEIQEIIDENKDFTDLVNDYLYCKKELKKLSNSKKYIIASEYNETLKELEKELLDHLKVHRKIHKRQGEKYPGNIQL